MADAFAALVDAGAAAGTIEIYDGTMPATVATAVTSQVALATIDLSDPAFGAAAAGVLGASGLPLSTTADASGTATWARVLDSDATPIADIDVTTTGGGGTMQLNTVALTSGGELSLTAFALTMPSGV